MMNLPECELVETRWDEQTGLMEVDPFQPIDSLKGGGGEPGGYSIEQDPCLHGTGVLVYPMPTVEWNALHESSEFGEMPDEEYAFFRDLLQEAGSSASQCATQQQQPCGFGSPNGDSLPEQFAADQEAMELMGELMHGTEHFKQQLPAAAASAAGATTSAPKVPMIEPQQQQQQQQSQHLSQNQFQHQCQHQDQNRDQYQHQHQHQHQHQTLEQPFSPASTSDDCFESNESLSFGGREAEIDAMVAYIKEVIEKSSSTKPDDMSSKLKVHEVILTILLNSAYGDRSKDLRRILAFCDENGRECSGECRHFKTLDTETMGLLWKKIKGNRKASYDTFARAMRVRREKSLGYFDYLDSGKRSKKRIYRFGDKTMAEMARLKKTLRQFSEPQACGY